MRTLAAFIYALNAADLATTHLVLNRGGYEANPLMANIAGHPAGIILKLVVVPILLTGMVYFGRKHSPRLLAFTLTIAATVYVWVVISNLAVAASIA